MAWTLLRLLNSMSEIELVANFSGAEPAYAAAEVLQELGYRGIHVIIAAQCTIRVRAPAESVDVVTSALHAAGALDLTSHPVQVSALR